MQNTVDVLQALLPSIPSRSINKSSIAFGNVVTGKQMLRKQLYS